MEVPSIRLLTLNDAASVGGLFCCSDRQTFDRTKQAILSVELPIFMQLPTLSANLLGIDSAAGKPLIRHRRTRNLDIVKLVFQQSPN
ncbi:MAG: hypothetical protein ACRC62_09445 [Microcoleus sp.]